MAFIEGYILGLAFVMFIGPVFFTLLQTTLQHGFKSGFMVALGISCSDFVVASLCLLGLASIFENPQYRYFVAIAGGIILIILGLQYIIKAKQEPSPNKEIKGLNYGSFFMQGFLINFINPFVFVVWIGVMGIASSSYSLGSGLIFFILGTLGGILSTDTLKATFALRLKSLVQPKILVWVFRGIGIILVVFGLGLIFQSNLGNLHDFQPPTSFINPIP